MSTDIEILEVSLHRNGSAASFHAIRFRFKPGDVFRPEEFLAVVFEHSRHIAIIGLDRILTLGTVAGRGNSWDGDAFEQFMRHVVALYKRGKIGSGQAIVPIQEAG